MTVMGSLRENEPAIICPIAFGIVELLDTLAVEDGHRKLISTKPKDFEEPTIILD